MMNLHKRLMACLMIVIILAGSISIPGETAAATVYFEEVNLLVGEEYDIPHILRSGKDWFEPGGKYTVSNNSVVGIKSQYRKKDKYWSDYIVALRPGSARITLYNKKKQKTIFMVTVKRTEQISPSAPYDLTESEKKLLAGINLEQYNTDRKRLAAVTWKLSNENFYTKDSYGSRFARRIDSLFSSMGYEVWGDAKSITSTRYNILKLEGKEYYYQYHNYTGYCNIYGSEEWNLDYVGEEFYTDDTGNSKGGSVYRKEDGELEYGYMERYQDDIAVDFLEGHKENIENYLGSKKSHLPAWLIGADTRQQTLFKGETKRLPQDALSTSYYTSDESVVTIDGSQLKAVNPGIAIVYRYNEDYLDAFYVMVDSKSKGKSITTNFKKDGKLHKSYTDASFASYRSLLEQRYPETEEVWSDTVTQRLEAVCNGGKLVTEYKNGLLAGYVIDEQGVKSKVISDKERVD